MATTIENFDSVGGFSVDKTTVVDELRNGKDFNSFELKNSSFTDSSCTQYILRGINTAVLQLDNNAKMRVIVPTLCRVRRPKNPAQCHQKKLAQWSAAQSGTMGGTMGGTMVLKTSGTMVLKKSGPMAAQ